MASRTSGTADKVAGSAKDTLGSVTGNHSLQAEGKAQNAHGTAEDEAKKGQNRAEATGEGITGWAKQTLGALTGNDQREAEGRADRAKADVKSSLNK
ncbi:hypothetical protein PhCBS80983_g00984 [Powellomyces hirtus]|uniref:CsbD-like domain-containing protein n=1 Tax=Powellomyces hirtus TaxID=109895 RepID=A0A507ECY3_9FUNG|nr:hypothetical protein DFJ77DRAFT_476842 [Powellomyces hirtus]TPX61664.1 hypothetical protein PhCBS80983_g00984 [Powellomyces hirtus]